VKLRAAAFDNPDYLFELKYDGFRALLEIDGGEARLVSRNRNRFRHLDPLAAALAKRLRVTDAILDGELISADQSGRPIFMDLLRRRAPASFIAFDLLWLNGEDLRSLPLTERKKRLRRLLRRRFNHLIAEAMTIDGRGRALMAAVLKYDLEGVVAKRKADP
jgi:bifunctional non-homologous end joining protein LigD